MPSTYETGGQPPQTEGTSVSSTFSKWLGGQAGICVFPGLCHGLTLPSVRLQLALQPTSLESLGRAQQGLHALAHALGFRLSQVSFEKQAGGFFDLQPLVEPWLILMSNALRNAPPIVDQHVSGGPHLLKRAALFKGTANPGPGLMLIWPTYWPDLLAPVLSWALDQWSQLALVSNTVLSDTVMADVKQQWKDILVDLIKKMPSGINPPRLLAACLALNRPAFWLDRETLQVGFGRQSRLFRSTLTESTASLAVTRARDKVLTNRLLRDVGIPVPQHLEVKDLNGAHQAAQKLGWPVVIKPADRDRGEGARANLQTFEQINDAYEHAKKISPRVLVEKHIAGNEYRLTVVNGVLFWAHERVPASVTGDGIQTLQQLINTENDKRRQDLLSNPAGWVPIQMDAANLSYLQENGLSLQSIPAVSECVRLQRIPAANTGGGGRAFFDTIHPENKLLAERAAQILRLDIAGVDLITPDIRRSWREAGGAVTEVNAVPQISIQTDPSLMLRLVQKVMPHSGRIPLLFVLTDNANPTWLEPVVFSLSTGGLRVGVSTGQALHIGADWIRGPRNSVWNDVRAMQMDPSVDAMVIVSDGKEWINTGLPFDAVDAMVVETYHPEVTSLMKPYLKGFIAVLGRALQKQYARQTTLSDSAWQTWSLEPAAMLEQIQVLSRILLTAEISTDLKSEA